MKYKVVFSMDNIYNVVIYDPYEYDGDYDEIVHSGSLSDCEAYIRLKEGGYM